MENRSNQEADFILQEVKLIWNNTEFLMRPWGVWICNYQHTEYSDNEYKFSSNINKVWFLDQGQIIIKEKSEYIRFYVSQIIQPWCSSQVFPANPIFTDPQIKIGTVYFAKIQNFLSYYLEWQFGRHFGAGFSFKINTQGKVINRQQKSVF
ncbi:MAG: hypothetical protein ACRC1Z_18815 [Waterburya sp.]